MSNPEVNGQAIYGATWEAQTFTVSSFSHTIVQVSIYAYDSGTPVGNFTLGIRLTSSDKPTGNDLTNVSVVASTFFNSTKAWRNLTITPEFAINSSVVYAVVCSLPDSTIGNRVTWIYNASAPYSQGSRCYSTTSGSTWSIDANIDYGFKIFGNPISPTYNSAGVTTTICDTLTTCYSHWIQGNSSLDGYIFSWNDSGSFVNDTWTVFSNPANAWANVSHTITTTLGKIDQWFLYINSTDGINYTMPIQSFTVTVIVQYHISGNGDLLVNGTYVPDNTNTTYSASTVVQLDACPKNASYVFFNFTWNFGSSLDNRYNQTVVNNQSSVLWCYFESISVGVPFIYARFTMNDTAPYQNQDTVFFNASSSNCSSLPLTYYWDFGDLDTSTGETTTHIYLNSGIFTVNLTVVNGAMSDSMFQNITVFATSINITFDWNDLLFGSGAWLPFIAIMIAMFIGVAYNKWFIVAAFPIMALMSFLYFDHIATTPALVWEALIMVCSAIVLLIYSASRK